MIVVLFKSRATATVDAKEYGKLGQQLAETAATLPGFVSLDVFENTRLGENLIVARFESEEAEARWRDHAEHLAAQARRTEFYTGYDVQVCNVLREYRWNTPTN